MNEPSHRSVPESDGRPNEDALFLEDGVAVVVDGAGLPHSMRAGCHHSVGWYSSEVAQGFGTSLLDPDLTMRQALSRAITEVSLRHDGCRLATGSPSATVAAWRLRPPVVEYLVLCDASEEREQRQQLLDGAIEVHDDATLVALASAGLC